MRKNDVWSNKSEIRKICERTDKATGDIHDSNCRSDCIEAVLKKLPKDVLDTMSLYERLVSLERYSRDFKLCFCNVSVSTGEDCILK